LFLGRFMPVGDSDNWMACADRLRLRLLRADDVVPLRSVMEPGLVKAVVAQTGNRALTPWAVVLRDGGDVAGFCGFFVRPVKGTTMGYGIAPEYRGHGLATEAAAAVLDWAERNGVDFYASVRPPNPASVRVLEKVGMRLVDSYLDEDGQRDIYRR
jgi:GNAT superfamily N-acetyltransferase